VLALQLLHGAHTRATVGAAQRRRLRVTIRWRALQNFRALGFRFAWRFVEVV
jgi:hypothetical protein